MVVMTFLWYHEAMGYLKTEQSRSISPGPYHLPSASTMANSVNPKKVIDFFQFFSNILILIQVTPSSRDERPRKWYFSLLFHYTIMAWSFIISNSIGTWFVNTRQLSKFGNTVY